MSNKWDDFKKKGEKLVNDLEKNPQFQGVKDKAAKNPKEAIFGALMVLGLIFSYYWFGSLVVGLAAGLFAPWAAKEILNRGEMLYKQSSKLTSFMWAATIVFFLFHTPWFVIGFVLGLVVKAILNAKPQK